MAPTRRELVAGLAGLTMLAAVGCSRSAKGTSPEGTGSSSEGSARPSLAKSMTVYRDPGCGCCEQWAERARSAGYEVAVADNNDMPAIKRKFGVPAELASCHTALIGGYVLEGHVPLDQVQRLLEARPAGVKGLAVPGMPLGSPGMEMSDGSGDPFTVFAFDDAGRVSVFAEQSVAR